MAARGALLVIGLLLVAQSPSLAKAKAHHAAKSVSRAATHPTAQTKSTAAIEPQSRDAEQAAIKTEIKEQPAVLQPDGTEDDSQPAKALYTDSDDVG